MNLSNCAKVIEYCETHGSITAREAFIKLNINSPRKVISDLRKKGYIVQADKMYNGGKTPYHRYTIVGKIEGDSVG